MLAPFDPGCHHRAMTSSFFAPKKFALSLAVTSLLPISTLATPAVARAVDLESGGGFLFDIQDDFGGYLSNGSVDAYDGCYYLDVGGTRYSPSGSGTLSPDGRTVTLPTATIAGVTVQRVIYVPATGGDWARYLEVLDNPGATDITTTVRISGNLGSDGGTRLIATSSGDATLEVRDSWFSTDDTDGTLDPSLAHLFQAGPDSGAPVSVRTIGLATDNLDWTFDVVVPAGGRAVVMTFVIQTMTQALAQAEAVRLVDLPDDTFVGMEDYETDIVNFPPRTILTDCTGARVGARCDDGLFCTRRDRCTDTGSCVGSGDPCDDGNACTVDTCAEATDTCRNETTPDRCIIGGECVANGVVHPAYPCLYCDPARSTRDWSAREPGTSCGEGSCTGGRLIAEATCSMTGVCLRAAPERCAIGYCEDGVSCASMCADGDCPGDSYCAPSGACELPRANGSSCTEEEQCQDGQCVDGICCSEACTETCRSCIVPGHVGTCTDVPAMTDPDRECVGGFCDGAGSCGTGDGGTLADAAMSPDAGARDDAGALDAAVVIDASLTIDAAIAPPDEGGGCSASTSRSRSALGVSAMLGLALTIARRRARR